MPSEYAVRVEPQQLSFTVRTGEPILSAARRAGVWLPFECGWGSCGTCKLTLVEGIVQSLHPETPAVKPQDERRRKVLICQSIACSDLVLRVGAGSREFTTPRTDLPTADYSGQVLEVEPLGPEIRLFRFALDRPANFLPGQYAILELAPGLRRAYSMVNLPGEASVEFLVKRYAGRPGTERLFALEPGETVPLELPYGAAYYRDTPRPSIFVAGGTGIAPILSMLRVLATDGHNLIGTTYVFYGTRTSAELVHADEVAEICRTLGAIFIPVVEQADADWTGEQGFVTGAMKHLLPPPWQDYTFYMAGPPPMVWAMLRLLDEMKVTLSRIHYDSFG